MANTVLTPTMILRESYAILHQKSNFVTKTNRQYDDRYQIGGYKLGESINVRLPPKYTVRTGNSMSVQNLVERQVALPRGTVKGVDLNFSQTELSLSISDFSERVLKPALSQLASSIETDCLSMYKSVANYAGSVTTSVNYRSFQNTGRYMTDQLAPMDGNRTMTLSTKDRVDFSTDVKGLFQSAARIEEQYSDGVVGKTGGFNVFENTLIPAHVNGYLTGAFTSSVSTGASGSGNAYTATFDVAVSVGTSYAFNKGDILTFAGVYDVNPESRLAYGYLKRFTLVSSTSGTTSGTLTISPAPIYGGAYQNVSASIAAGATIVNVGAGTQAVTYNQSLGFHKDAFAIVFADLEDPSQYGAWGARAVQDNMSMRIWRQGDIANGAFPCRVDVCYGFAPIYPEWATRLISTTAEA